MSIKILQDSYTQYLIDSISRGKLHNDWDQFRRAMIAISKLAIEGIQWQYMEKLQAVTLILYEGKKLLGDKSAYLEQMTHIECVIETAEMGINILERHIDRLDEKRHTRAVRSLFEPIDYAKKPIKTIIVNPISIFVNKSKDYHKTICSS